MFASQKNSKNKQKGSSFTRKPISRVEFADFNDVAASTSGTSIASSEKSLTINGDDVDEYFRYKQAIKNQVYNLNVYDSEKTVVVTAKIND